MWGGKFLPHWDVERVCNWIAAQVESAGWTLEAQEPNPLVIRLTEDAGLVEGRTVRTIHIRTDGRHIHAYPAED